MHLIVFTLLWLVGIWSADAYPHVIPLQWWLLCGLTSLAVAIPLAFAPKYRQIALIAAGLTFFFFGGARQLWSQPILNQSHVSHYLEETDITLIGVVSDQPDVRDRTINLRLSVEHVELKTGSVRDVTGDVLIRTPRFPEIPYGTRLTVKGKLETPFEDAEFSYRDYLNRQGMYGVMPFPRVLDSAAGHGNSVYAWLFSVKAHIQNKIAQIVVSPESGLLSGILLGIDHTMPPDIDEAFRTVGITHIVVISGFNIALLSSIFLTVFTPIFGRWYAVYPTLFAIVLFTLLVGADASVVRAAIMGSAYVLSSRWLGRRNASVPILFGAGLFLTMLNPNALWDIGFQLSFAATLSLMLFATPVMEAVRVWLTGRFPADMVRWIMNVIGDAVLVTVAAQILTLPLIMFYFNQLSLISLLANALVLPVQPMIMIWGGLATLVGFIWPILGQLLGWVVWVPLWFTIQTAQQLAQVPFAAVTVPFGLNAFIATYTIIFAAYWFGQKEVEFRKEMIGKLTQNIGRRAAITTSLVGTILGWQWTTSQPDGLLHITYFDVGQGDATLIQTPTGRQILVDGGYYPTQMNRHLGQSMPLGDRHIDVLIATHPDADHVTGLPELFDRYTFSQLLVAYPKADGEGPYAELLARAEAAGTELLVPQIGEVLTIDDGVFLEIIHPGSVLSEESRNDNSLSFRLVYGDTRALFTGDAEEVAERQMMQNGKNQLNAQIYKAGHHGARNASSPGFLEVVQPELVIVSAGENNRFGHPHPEVLHRASEQGAIVLRTDEVGTIEVISDGRSTWWRADHPSNH
ncbi:MAG: DNA internalization-related competence protein ComEC/Rec2 [Chloroflexota bacterium]